MGDTLVVRVRLDRRGLVDKLTAATGLPWEEVYDHLRGYVELTAAELIADMLGTVRAEQENFVAYVMHERAKTVMTQRTALVGAVR